MRKGVMMILKKMMVMTLVVAMVASNLQVVSAVDENAEVIPTAETKSGESTMKTPIVCKWNKVGSGDNNKQG